MTKTREGKARGHGAISYQVSIRGRGIDRLTHDALTELVYRRIDGGKIPDGIEVRVYAWRDGRELDWEADNPRAAVLRENIRRQLQRGAFDW